ncbi:IF44L-like protein, partial [Mya arenaria]
LVESLKEEVKGIRPPAGLDVPYFNILLMGPLGSGKSSFCNLMASVFRGGISQQAGVGGSSESSTTTMFTVGDKVSLQLYDTRGIADTDTLDLMQCNYILEDNVPDFYEMPLASLMSNDDADFQQRPTLSNKIHCVVFVLDGSTVGDIPTPVLHKLKWYRDLLNRKGIPQAVLVTQIDKLCDKTAENVCNTFFSPNVQEVIEKVADLLKFPRNSIWPVKNYEEEVESDESVNILALLAVRQIMYLAEDYLENMKVNKRRRSQRLKTKQAKKAKCERYGSDTATN